MPLDGKLGESHSGELHRETAAQKANRILAEELSRRGWTESDLTARRRNDPGKLAIAVRLRNETALPVKWIAARVQIGTTKELSPCSIGRVVDPTTPNPRGPTNHAHNWNSYLRFEESGIRVAAVRALGRLVPSLMQPRLLATLCTFLLTPDEGSL